MDTLKILLAALALLTSAGCMLLLFRAYAQNGMRLLLWSAFCFVFLTVNNGFLLLDFLIAHIDFRPYRLASSLAAIVFLLYGFIWEAE